VRYVKYLMIALFTCVVTLSVDEIRLSKSCDSDGITRIAGNAYFCADWNATIEVFRRLRDNQQQPRNPV
jgi:hypothetical protein